MKLAREKPRILIYWEHDQVWYYGTIEKYSYEKHEFLVEYADDKTEELDLSEERFIFAAILRHEEIISFHDYAITGPSTTKRKRNAEEFEDDSLVEKVEKVVRRAKRKKVVEKIEEKTEEKIEEKSENEGIKTVVDNYTIVQYSDESEDDKDLSLMPLASEVVKQVKPKPVKKSTGPFETERIDHRYY